VVVLLLAGAAGATYKYVGGTSDDSSDSQPGVAVQTEAFSFVLPDTPTIEPLGNIVVGIQTTGTQWTVASGSSQLTVLAMSFGVVLDAATQQAAFDETITGRALLASGTIVSDTWLLTEVGVYERDTIVAVPEGIIHMKSYGKGAWAVFVLGPSGGSERPPGFTELIVSFSFV
jgi:hypothetical protein